MKLQRIGSRAKGSKKGHSRDASQTPFLNSQTLGPMCVILALSDPECPLCSCVLKQVLDWVARICLHFHVSISAVNEPGAHIICNILKEVQLSHGNVSCSLVIHQVQDLDGSTDKIYIFPNKTSDTQRSFITRKWKQHLCCFLLYVL